ncbi:tyrosine-protein kinase transmembrane receptor Ror2-like [Centruroides sculpturatus]|uniref:tyrosine-protein kinase transmembrane receptor Ror2-like n=1 Tax=Centruroides sculpturatus TaxID=218467 RepID=UPI000C6E80B9|nr:tyrosine-protein kinase transmembrane receptor Ror2-like [Centruroides sculpturatus]
MLLSVMTGSVVCRSFPTLSQKKLWFLTVFAGLLFSSGSCSIVGEPVIVESPVNRTVVMNDNVIFSCGTTGEPRPQISWHRNGRSLHHNGHATYKILENGSLVLENVGPADDGMYRCIARNEKGAAYSDLVRLKVEVPAKIEGGRTIYNVSWGSSVSLECSSEGDPPPVVSWWKGNKPISHKETVFSHSLLNVNATITSIYTCRATNYISSINTSVTDSKDFVIYVLTKSESFGILEETEISEEIDDNFEESVTKETNKNDVSSGYCSVYTGTICKKHLKGVNLVFYNYTTDGMVNEEITTGLWEEVISSLMEPCRTAAETLLCTYAFPRCEWINGIAVSKPVCKEDCIAVRELFCYNEWALIEDNKQRGIYFKSRGHFRLPFCDILPYRVNSTNSCSDGRLTEMKEEEITKSFGILEETEISEEIDDNFEESVTKETNKNDVSSGYCSVYTGTICKKHLKGVNLVFYNYTTDGMVNEEITTGLWEEVISSLMEPCRTAAETLLCTYAFPRCEWINGIAVSKPVCKEDCIAVRELFCYNEWALIEDNKQRGIYFKSRGHFRLPFCDILPYRVNSTNSCSDGRLTEMKEEEITIKRPSEHELEPHHHNRPPMVFPEVSNSENYCRNAGGEEPVPWCYTMDPRIRWQHCDIPRCENNSYILGSDFDMSDIFDTPTEPIFTPSFILIICSLSLAGIVVILAMVLGFRRLQKYRSGYNATPTTDVEIDLDKLPSNMSYHHTSAQLNPKLENLEYPRNDIIYIRDIGQGAFGRVFQAKAPGLTKGEEFTMVAVKMLKEEATEDLQSDFEREACLMAEFDHTNIVKLLGVCAIGKPMCLLFEYMGRGDLNEFLRSCAPTNYIVRTANGDIFNDVRLTHLDLLNIARQIAAGMVYLSERKFVHRDLATRNCLVSDDMVVKIADFGLSQKIYAANYYKGNEHDAIPIRWMPLESILYSKFTVESDVWAFGVVLWEIFSFALQPYYGMTHEEVVKFIKEGNILVCPDNTPAPIYNLMKATWNRKPANRPSFKTIFKTLGAIYEELNRHQIRDQRVHV